jgi:hypothetical protein
MRHFTANVGPLLNEDTASVESYFNRLSVTQHNDLSEQTKGKQTQETNERLSRMTVVKSGEELLWNEDRMEAEMMI